MKSFEIFAFVLATSAILEVAADDVEPEGMLSNQPRLWPPWHVKDKNGRNIASKEEWDALPSTVRQYWEAKFAKSYFDEAAARVDRSTKVQIPAHLIPVYFWPLDRVALPCKMGVKQQSTNAVVKEWLVIPYWNWTHALTVKDGQKTYLDSRDALTHSIWRTAAQFESGRGADSGIGDMSIQQQDDFPLPHTAKKNENDMPKNNAEGSPPRPIMYQRNGHLVIYHANPNVQGIYTCTDSTSTSVEVAYLVMAMMPLVWSRTPTTLPRTTIPLQQRRGEPMDKPVQYIASWYWRFHSIPMMLSKDCPEVDFSEGGPRPMYKNGDNFEHCHQMWEQSINRTQIETFKHTEMFLTDGTQKWTGDNEKENVAPVMAQFAWSSWSPCTNCEHGRRGSRVREGHCYISPNSAANSTSKLLWTHGFSKDNWDNSDLKCKLNIVDHLMVLFDNNPHIFDGTATRPGLRISSGLLLWIAFYANTENYSGGPLAFDRSRLPKEIPKDHNPLPIGRFPNNDHFKCPLNHEHMSAPQLIYDLIYYEFFETPGQMKSLDGRLCYGANRNIFDAEGSHITVGYFFDHEICGGEKECKEM